MTYPQAVLRELNMVIKLTPDLEGAIAKVANDRGVSVEALALDVLSLRFLGNGNALQPRDEWERGLLAAAKNCGVSLSNAALSSESLYD